jgi:hypothetical protein
LCTQVNNGLLIEDAAVAKLYREQWDNLKDASPPELDPADFPDALVEANDKKHSVTVGDAKVTRELSVSLRKQDGEIKKAAVGGAVYSEPARG